MTCTTYFELLKTTSIVERDLQTERAEYTHSWGLFKLAWAHVFTETFKSVYAAFRYCVDSDGVLTNERLPDKTVEIVTTSTKLTPYGQLVSAVNASNFSVGMSFSGDKPPTPFTSSYGNVYPIVVHQPSSPNGLIITATPNAGSVEDTRIAVEQDEESKSKPLIEKVKTGVVNYSATINSAVFISDLYIALMEVKSHGGGSSFTVDGSELSFTSYGVTAKEFKAVLQSMVKYSEVAKQFIYMVEQSPDDAQIFINAEPAYGQLNTFTKQK